MSPAASERSLPPALRTLRAAWVIARRDFVAVLFSKSFGFFLAGPLLPLIIGLVAGGIGHQVAQSVERPQIGIAMGQMDNIALLYARERLVAKMAGPVPELVVIRNVEPGDRFDPEAALRGGPKGVAAVLSGTLEAPNLTAPAERLAAWEGLVATLAAVARAPAALDFPELTTTTVTTSAARINRGRVATAQGAQMVLFLLTMLLAGMVLSNLVEEKANKIVEVLAAAVPMDGIFLGKLFAMLAVSLVGITVWLSISAAVVAVVGSALPPLPAPAIGWPLFLLLGLVYFAMAYLLLGSLFLGIGGLASTVRQVQTLSMPVTMLQLLVFFFSSYALSQSGGWVEWAAAVVPFSSPYVMLAHAAQFGELWPHALALVWQAAWVALIVRLGAGLFRRAVMQSGAARGRPSGRARRWFGLARNQRRPQAV